MNRGKVALRYMAVAGKYTPMGYSIKYRQSLSGLCWYDKKLIEAPNPVTARALAIYLHECAHAVLGHSKAKAKPVHRMEYEAYHWCFEVFRREGLEPHPKSVDRAQGYVRHKIQQALRRKAKYIDREAAVFAYGAEAETVVKEYGATLV